MPYEYKVIVRRVVDGDTVEVDVDLGFGIWLRNQIVRFVGIDAPETRTLDLDEKALGIAAKTRVQELLPLGEEVVMRSVKPTTSDRSDAKDKYGRVLGDFIIGDRLLTDLLLSEGHAKIYS